MNPKAQGSASREHQLHLELGPDVRLVARMEPGDRFVDLRLWRRAPNAAPTDAGAWRVTSAGFRLPSERIGDIRAILAELQRIVAP